jgi:hypothetical protein
VTLEFLVAQAFFYQQAEGFTKVQAAYKFDFSSKNVGEAHGQSRTFPDQDHAFKEAGLYAAFHPHKPNVVCYFFQGRPPSDGVAFNLAHNDQTVVVVGFVFKARQVASIQGHCMEGRKTLNYTKWECKYHIVWPSPRRKLSFLSLSLMLVGIGISPEKISLMRCYLYANC